MIAWAYDLKGDASWEFLERNPAVIGKNYYDIQAVATDPVIESQCRLMVQALLASRFKLAVHWESREGQISDLVVARSGSKIQKARETDEGADLNIVVDGRLLRRPPRRSQGRDDAGAEFLTDRRTFQPIIDKTGLRYSTFLPRDSQEHVDPELETALAQHLGLRLEKHKGSVWILVLDHIETPTAN